MNNRSNKLKAAKRENPDHIPLTFNVSAGCWNYYPQNELQDLMAAHPILFPGFIKKTENITPAFAPWRRAGKPYTDSWGCVWETAQDGLTGAVVRHALPDWSMLPSYNPPSPDHHDGWRPIDWNKKRNQIQKARKEGRLAIGSLRHGHTFLTLTYLRGFENLVFDMFDENPQLDEVVDMVKEFNMGLVNRYVAAGAEWIKYPEDLGMQQGPMLSPELFRKYIRPVYEAIIEPARKAGCIIHMHSDGDIRDLAGDLMEIGIDVLNIQDLVNGIDWMEENLKGRVAIDLDIDRQNITRFGTPEEIRRHIREAVEKLAEPEGGLMLNYGLYPGVSLENAAAVMDAMEECSARQKPSP